MKRYCQYASLLLTFILGLPSAYAKTKNDTQLNWINAPVVFRDAMKTVLPSLVLIETYGVGQAAKTTKRGKGAIAGLGRLGDGPSTGVLVKVTDRKTYIVTSTFQFLNSPTLITVSFNKNDKRIGKMLGKDLTRKICILEVESKPDDLGRISPFVNVQSVRVGQYAMTVGLGYGADEPALSVGIISAKKRMFGKALQTDANISPANYGGPLIDLDGHVLGICVPYSPFGKEPFAGVEWYDSGIGFAIPISVNNEIIERLINGETLHNPMLGVAVKVADKQKGLEVIKVTPASAAHLSGIKARDTILELGSHKTENIRQLKLAIGGHVAGEKVKIKLLRNGEAIFVIAKLQKEIKPKINDKTKAKVSR